MASHNVGSNLQFGEWIYLVLPAFPICSNFCHAGNGRSLSS